MTGFRSYFSLLMIFLFVCFLTYTSSAAEKPIVIHAGHIFAPGSATDEGALKFAEFVSKRTNGRIQVKIFPASQLGGTTAQLQNVKMGTQEILFEALVSAARVQTEMWALAIPFLLKNDEQAKNIYSGPIVKDICEKLLKGSGIRVLTANWARSNRILLTKSPVSKLSDLKGMKLRVPTNPMFVKCWKALGASPTPMELPEVYMGLQQGILDGVELTIDLMYGHKHYEIAKNLTLTNHQFEFTAAFMNEKSFQSLSSDDKKVIQEASIEAGEYQNKVLSDNVKSYIAHMKKERVTFIEFPDSEKERWASITEKVGMDEEANGQWPKGLVSRIRAVR